VIGIDKDGDGKGEPVLTFKKPNVGKAFSIVTPAESDEFNEPSLGLQWQWQTNPRATWAFVNSNSGTLRLFSQKIPESARNYWDVPNILMQKFPAEEFKATLKITFKPNAKLENEKAGLIVMGRSYASLLLKSKKDGVYLVYAKCQSADKGNQETETVITKLNSNDIQLRVNVVKAGVCTFSYSVDGKNFTNIKESFQAEAGQWIGAKVGIFCTRQDQINDSGYADVDWFRIEK
jgi:beta-xylosidase